MRKLFYAPGMISLIGIFFFLTDCAKRIIPEKETIIQLACPNEKVPGRNEIPYFNVSGILKEVQRKRQINFLLDEDLLTNKKKLDIIQFEARKLKYTFDTSSIILVKLSESTPYGEFVKLLNVCLSDSIQRYATWGNYFAIFGEYPPRETMDTAFTCLLCNDVIIPPPRKRTFIEKLTAIFKPYLNLQPIVLLVGWVILLLTFLLRKKGSNFPSSTL